MLHKRNVLPPLDYMLAFEAAAKDNSFTRAARSLNISETAISRKVKLLELHYDVPLFVRGHRSITLTPQGQLFLDAILPALNTLRDVSVDMLSQHQKNSVTLAATNSVASLWLMPRLLKFNRSNARIKINLVASDSDTECLADTVNLTILRGNSTTDWAGYEAKLLFGETIFPVCSPQYLKQNPDVVQLEKLIKLDLIEVISRHPEWMDWKTWLKGQNVSDVTLNQSAAFNTYPLMIQAAVNGFGVALGWGHLVDDLLKSGELVRPLGLIGSRTDAGYYLLRPKSKKTFPECLIVEDWLLKASAARKRYNRS